MKKIFFILFITISFVSCNQKTKKEESEKQTNTMETTNQIDYSSKNFEDLFQKTETTNFNENVFNLIANAGILTSGDTNNYNSMAIGWGGFGIYFKKPTTFLFVRANRYTLEFIQKVKTYTITFYDTTYFDQIMHFGTMSGRGTDKMGTHRLHSVFTPLGNPAYKEANIIIECDLQQITTISPEDYYFDYGKNFVTDAYKEAGDYHKIIFGEIKNIWTKK